MSASDFPRRPHRMSPWVLGPVVLALGAALLAFEAWILMLLLGALHSLTDWRVAVGFWACVVIALIASVLGGWARHD